MRESEYERLKHKEEEIHRIREKAGERSVFDAIYSPRSPLTDKEAGILEADQKEQTRSKRKVFIP